MGYFKWYTCKEANKTEWLARKHLNYFKLYEISQITDEMVSKAESEGKVNWYISLATYFDLSLTFISGINILIFDTLF